MCGRDGSIPAAIASARTRFRTDSSRLMVAFFAPSSFDGRRIVGRRWWVMAAMRPVGRRTAPRCNRTWRSTSTSERLPLIR